MTLVTTPGAANADSYATVDEADTYFTARGVTTWTGTPAAKEAALRRGTTYLDNQYRGRWVGLSAAQTQALAWPRTDGQRDPYYAAYTYPIVDDNGYQIATTIVPQQVKTACMEAALLALTGVALEPRRTPSDYAKSVGKSVGPIRKDIVYRDDAPTVDRHTVIEGLLRGLVTSTPGATSGNVRLVRA